MADTAGKEVARAIASGGDPNHDLATAPEGNETRAAATVRLKLDGWSYSEIARELGYSSPTRARAAFERTLAVAADSPESRDQARWLANRRMERILRSVMPRGTDAEDPEHLLYARTALAIIDRQAKLWGLDAPSETIVHTPAAETVTNFVQRLVLLARENGDASIPADVVEAELED